MTRKLTPRIHRIKYSVAREDAKRARRTRELLSARLKIMLADLGLSPEQAGKMLHVTALRASLVRECLLARKESGNMASKLGYAVSSG
jgi:hypothetical protein